MILECTTETNLSVIQNLKTHGINKTKLKCETKNDERDRSHKQRCH